MNLSTRRHVHVKTKALLAQSEVRAVVFQPDGSIVQQSCPSAEPMLANDARVILHFQ